MLPLNPILFLYATAASKNLACNQVINRIRKVSRDGK